MSKTLFEFPLNIQRAILYLLKEDDDIHHQLRTLVKSEYFEFPQLGKLFKIISDHRDKYKKLPTDDLILNEARVNLGRNEAVSEYEDELAFIQRIGLHAVEHKEYLLDIVEKFARQAAMKLAVEKAAILVQQNNIEGIEDVVREALMVSRTVNSGQHYFKALPYRAQELEEDKKKIPFLIERINEHIDGGHSPKELCMVVASAGMGKSLLLVNQAAYLLRHGKKVLYISLEMSEEKIAKRFDSILSDLPISQLKHPSKKIELVSRVDLFTKENPDSVLIIKEFPTGLANVNTIRVLLNQLKNYEEFVPDVIFVDYLELLRPIRQIDQEYQAQQRIAEELRGLGVELDCLIWTATQANRDAKKAIIVKDIHLADSYGKIRTADWVISLNQTDSERAQGKMRGYVVKSRDSKNNYIFPICVDYSTLLMWDDHDEDMSNAA